MRPLFDFNGDGKMDMLEFMIASGAFEEDDPLNPLGNPKKRSSSDILGESDDLFDDEEED